MPASLGTPAVRGGPVIAVHGGAGTLERDRMTPELETACHDALREALASGHEILTRGGSALDGVTAAVTVLEDSPLFNAGRGSVYTWDGSHELDASIMDAATRRAGAVGGVRNVRNPIHLARRVMEASPHVFLAGPGAEAFARDQDVAFAPDAWFQTESRREQWRQLRESDRAATGPLVIGTVGAVALDVDGNLAAGTSSGGMTGKRRGRFARDRRRHLGRGIRLRRLGHRPRGVFHPPGRGPRNLRARPAGPPDHRRRSPVGDSR